MPQSLAKNLVHLIFSTKSREPWLNETIRPDLHAYMATVLKNMECPAIIINSVKDHVHLLFLLHRTVALSTAVGDLKKSSSKWIKTQSNELAGFTWQAGFGAFSVSESNAPAVKRYITNQAEHHRKVSFQDELRTFLVKHGVDYDERYLWD
jgi:REP element-mobilizing transposase RayT